MEHNYGDMPHQLSAEDTARLAQGIEVMMARLQAWRDETPGACACDSVEILARCFAITMYTAGRRLPERIFTRATNDQLRGVKEFLRDLRRDTDLIERLSERLRLEDEA